MEAAVGLFKFIILQYTQFIFHFSFIHANQIFRIAFYIQRVQNVYSLYIQFIFCLKKCYVIKSKPDIADITHILLSKSEVDLFNMILIQFNSYFIYCFIIESSLDIVNI